MEILALDEFHDHIGSFRVLLEGEDGDHVRMGKTREGGRLAGEGFAGRFVEIRFLDRQKPLQRDLPAHDRVVGAVDRAHPSPADPATYLVTF
jgi:hypothetical protein